MKKIIKNIFYLLFPLLIGGLVGLLIKSHIDYTSLALPPLAPPSIVFPIAWTILYFLMGISYLILNNKYKNDITYESIIYYIQLFLNAIWSILFFILKWRLVSLLWILLLDGFVIYMIYLFARKNKLSAYLNLPYIIWLLFATYLNLGILILN